MPDQIISSPEAVAESKNLTLVTELKVALAKGKLEDVGERDTAWYSLSQIPEAGHYWKRGGWRDCAHVVKVTKYEAGVFFDESMFGNQHLDDQGALYQKIAPPTDA